MALKCVAAGAPLASDRPTSRLGRGLRRGIPVRPGRLPEGRAAIPIRVDPAILGVSVRREATCLSIDRKPPKLGDAPVIYALYPWPAFNRHFRPRPRSPAGPGLAGRTGISW
jgi:hypothetical protein